MVRAAFLALGAFLAVLGAQCLAIDRFELRPDSQAVEPAGGLFSQPQAPAARVVEPPEWAAWSLMSVGAVTMLYAHTLKRPAGSA
jgi:hypothetical protein